jgi:hypothetical protein
MLRGAVTSTANAIQTQLRFRSTDGTPGMRAFSDAWHDTALGPTVVLVKSGSFIFGGFAADSWNLYVRAGRVAQGIVEHSDGCRAEAKFMSEQGLALVLAFVFVSMSPQAPWWFVLFFLPFSSSSYLSVSVSCVSLPPPPSPSLPRQRR